MKLGLRSLLASFALSSLVLAGCAADASSAGDDDAEDVGVSQDEISSLAAKFVGKYEWKGTKSGDFVDFQKLDLASDGTYTASVDAGLVDPGVRCIAFPCTLPEHGSWSAFKSYGKLKIRFRPSGEPSRSYTVSKSSGALELGRFGQTTKLFEGAQQLPCVKTGCSGHVCSDQDVITTCEFRPEYACYNDATCERQATGECGFTETPELTACLANP